MNIPSESSREVYNENASKDEILEELVLVDKQLSETVKLIDEINSVLDKWVNERMKDYSDKQYGKADIKELLRKINEFS